MNNSTDKVSMLSPQDQIARCKTCAHWHKPTNKDNPNDSSITEALDPDTYEPMDRGFETRICDHPQQTCFEPPVSDNTFALTDASTYYARLATAENFGCVLHKPA